MGKPKIRFKGYADDWEQRKLGDVCSRVQGNDGRMDLPTLTISAGNGWMRQEDRFSGNIAGKEQKNYTLLHRGELSYNHGNSKLAKYGTVFSLQTYEEALVPRVYHSFKVENGSADFVEYYFATKLPDKELGKLISSGARMDGLLNIGYEEFMRIPFLFPKEEEQNKISLYFRSLDSLITLHQRKCDETKKLKKYMLQKMFPQNGEKVPKIRFAGFSDDWEQRKFSELYVRSSEKNDGSIGMDKNITVATMQFKEDVQVSTAEYLKTYYTFNLGDIAFEGHQSKEFRYGRFVENDIGNGIVSHIFAVFRPIQEYDLYFWKYAINNETLMQRILGRSTKASTMMHDLVANDFLNETFLVPSIDEQKQIGSLFNKLDHLITLHQQKCDELQNIKKFMLKNMFV